MSEPSTVTRTGHAYGNGIVIGKITNAYILLCSGPLGLSISALCGLKPTMGSTFPYVTESVSLYVPLYKLLSKAASGNAILLNSGYIFEGAFSALTGALVLPTCMNGARSGRRWMSFSWPPPLILTTSP